VRRRLDAELVRRKLVPSRARAVEAIAAGRVRVGGAPVASAARQVAPDESIQVDAPAAEFVGRGGDKLAGALDRFGLDVTGLRGLDAGASTGGFTDCLLQRGAAHVVAVDVGRGQLAWRLREDPRVTVLERTNVRNLQPDAIGGPAEVTVADLSFISLRLVAPALARCTAPGADLVLLVKPQFEAGRSQVGKGGIVRDPAVHLDVLTTVSAALRAAGLEPVAVGPSPLRGADGNVEFVLHARAHTDEASRPGAESGASGWSAAVAAAVEEAHAAVAGAADIPVTPVPEERR
jgi:23S rRNA (cytidine1920-2'-O)/16S rRNA (cytidine1409-2'-O)-methyltransferase